MCSARCLGNLRSFPGEQAWTSTLEEKSPLEVEMSHRGIDQVRRASTQSAEPHKDLKISPALSLPSLQNCQPLEWLAILSY